MGAFGRVRFGFLASPTQAFGSTKVGDLLFHQGHQQFLSHHRMVPGDILFAVFCFFSAYCSSCKYCVEPHSSGRCLDMRLRT